LKYTEGNAVAVGHPEEHDSECELAVVEVKSSLDVCCVRLDHGMEFMPHEKGERIASVACDLSGNLVVTTGLLSYGRNKDWLVLSDANKCSEKWSGAVFFDLDGNFVGMNDWIHLPPRIVLERSTSTQRRAFRYVGMNGWFETVRDCLDDSLGILPGASVAPRRPISSAWGQDGCLGVSLPGRHQSKQGLSGGIIGSIPRHMIMLMTRNSFCKRTSSAVACTPGG
jgi:hypothetical protein